MRYANVDTIAFTEAIGRTVAIKDMREIPADDTSRAYRRTSAEDFDSIAARPDIYGEGGEAQAYKIHEANLIAILDARLDYTGLRVVKVPL